MVLSNTETWRAKQWISVAKKWKFALLFVFFVAACAGVSIKSDRQLTIERVNAYLSAHPGTGGEIVAAMRRYELYKGMNKSQVIAVWGQPTTKIKWRHGHDDQWYFECGWPNFCMRDQTRSGLEDFSPQAYFRDGVLYRWKTP